MLSCSLRAHNNSGQALSSTTEKISFPSHTSTTNGSSLTTSSDTLNQTSSISLNGSLHQTPVAPLLVPEPPVEPISVDKNQILMQFLLQRLPAIPTYEEVSIQSPFSSPISVYQPTSNFPDYVNHALLQQINASPTSLKPRVTNADTTDPESLNRMLPSLPSSPTFRNPTTTSNTVPKTEPVITPDTLFTSNSPGSSTVVQPIFESAEEFVNAPTPNIILKNSDTTTHLTQPSSLPYS